MSSVVCRLSSVQVSGFDLLEDEAVVDNHVMDVSDVPPADWFDPSNPGFAYYFYYVYANLVSLNQLRRYIAIQTTVSYMLVGCINVGL